MKICPVSLVVTALFVAPSQGSAQTQNDAPPKPPSVQAPPSAAGPPAPSAAPQRAPSPPVVPGQAPVPSIPSQTAVPSTAEYTRLSAKLTSLRERYASLQSEIARYRTLEIPASKEDEAALQQATQNLGQRKTDAEWSRARAEWAAYFAGKFAEEGYRTFVKPRAAMITEPSLLAARRQTRLSDRPNEEGRSVGVIERAAWVLRLARIEGQDTLLIWTPETSYGYAPASAFSEDLKEAN